MDYIPSLSVMLIIISCSPIKDSDVLDVEHRPSTPDPPCLNKTWITKKSKWLQYHLLISFREFIEEGVVDYAKKNPSTVVYVSPQASRIPKIVAEYCKCSWLCVWWRIATGADNTVLYILSHIPLGRGEF